MASIIKVTISPERFLPVYRKNLRRIRGNMKTASMDIGGSILRGWRRRVRRSSGKLARSGRVVAVQGRSRARIVINPSHMDPVWEERNTKAHRITAKPGRVLRWIGRDGQVHFAHSVFHPGTRGSRALERSVRANRRSAGSRVLRALDE